MLVKQHRLTDKVHIATVRGEGKRQFGKYATLFIYKSGTAAPTQFAFVVSKRVSHLAVARNRTRRLLREAVYTHLQSINNDFLVLCVAKMNLSEVPLQAITADIVAALRKSGVIKK